MFIVILLVAIGIASTHVSDKDHGKPTSNEIYERELKGRKQYENSTNWED